MGLEQLQKDELLALIQDAVKSAVDTHPLSPEEIQWVRLAIQAEAQRAAFRKAVIEKSLIMLILGAAGWIGSWLIDVFHTYFQHRI